MDHFCILFLIEKDVPARHERRTTCRWGISRLCVNRNAAAGIAIVSQTKPGARYPAPEGAHLPVGDIALRYQSQRSCGHRGQCHRQNSRRVLLPAGPPATAGGCRAGGQCPLPNRAVASFETKSWASRTMSQIKLRARFVFRRSVGGFGGSRRFFGPSRGNPVVLAPGIGRKIAAHTAGKAASPNKGDIQGGTPWITFASFS